MFEMISVLVLICVIKFRLLCTCISSVLWFSGYYVPVLCHIYYHVSCFMSHDLVKPALLIDAMNYPVVKPVSVFGFILEASPVENVSDKQGSTAHDTSIKR